MAGKSQLVAVANTNHGTELTEIVSVRKKRVESIGERMGKVEKGVRDNTAFICIYITPQSLSWKPTVLT